MSVFRTMVPIAELAANAEIIDGLNLNVINAYRDMMRHGDNIEAIKLYGRNKTRLYVIKDGHHRAVAALLEGHYQILVEEITEERVECSWRHPRILPLTSLVPKELHIEREIKINVDAVPGGRPGDVPKFIPPGTLNAGPRDERGQLKAGEPRTVEDRLAALFGEGRLMLRTDGEDETYTLTEHDRDIVIRALRATNDAAMVCDMVLHASMSETRPMRGESFIGWQRGDDGDNSRVRDTARNAIVKLRGHA